MQASQMGTIDTSLAILPDEHHGLPKFCYQHSRTPPPSGSRQCRSCCSLYYQDLERCLRVIPGPGPIEIRGKKWATSAREIYLRSDICVICHLLCALITGISGRFEETIDLMTLSNGACLVEVEGTGDNGWLLPEREFGQYDIMLGSKTSRVDHLDPGLIRGWIGTCERNHKSGDNPARTPRLKDPIDITLIDVVDQRLVYGSSSMAFCALSYVWGGVEGFRTTSANRAALELPGSLQQPQVSSQIPQTIKDAMRLVSLVGERYLWVDALCIQQDNAAMKHNQIMQMDIIYGHAMLTIINLSGENADAPLPRVPSEADVLVETASTGTSMRQQAGPVNRTGLVPVGCDINSTIESSTYDTRAWAFQERLLSERCIFLGEYQCFFLCHSHLQAELTCRRGIDYALDILPDWNSPSPSWFVDLSLKSQDCEQPIHFGHFQELLGAYRKKRLSWESDTLNALSGILAALTEQSGWTFLSGLPEQHLEFGLLWIPGDSRPIRRIKGFPTWSWAAWDCIPVWDQTNMLSGALSFSVPHEARSEIDGLETFRQTPRRLISRELAVPTRTSSSSDTGAGLDVLAFHAFTVSFQYFCLENDDPQYPKKHKIIYDFKLRPCGVFCKSSKATEDPTEEIDTQMEIVLLSRFRREKGSFTGNWIWGTAFNPPKAPGQDGITGKKLTRRVFFDAYYPYSDWTFLNVMFIRWERGYAERVCVGVMHERAFDNANPTWKEILLA